MKKLLKKSRLGKLCTVATALSVAAVSLLPTCSTAVEQTTTSATLEKVPYTVIRTIGCGNGTGNTAVYNDGQFPDNSNTFYYYDTKAGKWVANWGGSNTWSKGNDTAQKRMGVTLEFDAINTEFTNILLYSGSSTANVIKNPETNLKVRYINQKGVITSSIKSSDDLLAVEGLNELKYGTDFTIENVTNGTRGISTTDAKYPEKMTHDVLNYKYNGAETKTTETGDVNLTYNEMERPVQILSVNFKNPVKAGAIFVSYEPTDNLQYMVSEIEVYNNKSGNKLFGNAITEVYPDIINRHSDYKKGGYSAFGVVPTDGNGSYIEQGGISLTDGKKTAPSKTDRPNGRNANRWFVNDTTAFGVPYVEYNMDGKTKIDQLVVYSGLLDEPGTYKDVADAETAYGAVDPAGVSVVYQDESSDVWKTADIKIASDYGDETSNGTKLTINFGEITPTKLRLYAGIGTYASSTEPSAIFVKEIEAYDTEETNFIVNAVDIIRADSGIKGDLAKRSKTTYVAKNSNKTNKSMSDITLTLSSAVEENAQITVTAKGSTKTQPTVGNTVLAEDKKSAYVTISELTADTTYEVSITGCKKVYTFTTAGDYVITKYGFDETEGSRVKVSYDIQKVGSGADNLIGIVAVYDNDGRVIGCDSVKMIFKGEEGNKCSGTLNAEIPAGYENTTAKAFLFKAESLSPVMEFVPKR